MTGIVTHICSYVIYSFTYFIVSHVNSLAFIFNCICGTCQYFVSSLFGWISIRQVNDTHAITVTMLQIVISKSDGIQVRSTSIAYYREMKEV